MTTNRLRSFLRTCVAISGFGTFFLFFAVPLNAQSSAFNFTYNGPLVFPAGPGCSRSLQSIFTGNEPVVTATTLGATVTMSMYDPTGTLPIQYAYTDLIPAPFTLTVGWFVKDNLGNSHTFQIVGIKIVDNVAPTFDLTNHPPTLSFNSIAQVPPPVWPPFSDNCGFAPVPDTMYTQSGTVPPICSSGTFMRTWKVTDLNNNTATFTQTIQIFRDTLPPTVSQFPQNGSAPCSQIPTAYPAWIAAQMANFTASDPSGIKQYTNNAPLPFPPGCTAPVTVRFRAIDNCNLSFPVDVTFTSFDNQPPVPVQDPRDSLGYCSPTNSYLVDLGKWIKNHGYLQAYDSCSAASYFTYSMKIGGVVRDSAQVVAALQASFSGACGNQIIGNKLYNKVRGKVLVEFLVKDACNNEASMGEALFGVIDTVPPIITGIGLDEECGGGNDQTFLQTWINAHGNATFTDECSTVSWTDFSWTTSNGQTGTGTFGTGPYPTIQANNCTWWVDVTFRASDDCGNVGFKKLRFQIKDTTKPAFPAQPTMRVYCPDTEPAIPLPTVPATDNCDAILAYASTKQTVPGSCSGNYNVVVTFTATDDCGNTSTGTQIYEIRDTVRPIFTLVPVGKTFRCDTFALPAPAVLGMGISADDPFGCSVILPNALTTSVASGKNPDPALCGHYTYPITRTFTVRDDCGNTATATQVLNVVDNLSPVLSGFSDTTIACELPLVFLPPTSVDACGSPVTPPVKVSDVTSAGPCPGSPIRTWVWESKDVCDNKGVFEQMIFVRDTAHPVILTGVPPNISVECDAIPTAPLFSNFTMDDNCDASPVLSFLETELRDPNTANCNHWTNYVIRRQWTATDNCGNARTYTQDIQVQDNTGPLLTAVQPIMLPADQGVCGATVVVPSLLSVRDICTSLGSSLTLRDTVALVNTSGLPNNQVPVDTVVFQWSSPNLPPTVPVVGPATLIVTLQDADANDSTETLRILGEDNSLLGFTRNIAGQCSGQSSDTVSITADQMNAWLTDGQLNIRLAAKGITPVNNEVNAVCPSAFAYAQLSYGIASQQTPIALTYRLDANPALAYPPSGSTFLTSGMHTIVYTATDCAGNTSSVSTTVSIQDLQPPTVTAPANQTYFVGQNNCESVVTLPFPGITDNCDVSGMLMKTSPLVSLDFASDPDAGFIPKDVTLNITGLIPNAVGFGKLIIRHRGDNAQVGEFFKVFDENNNQVATTSPSTTGDCNANFHESSFVVTAALLNQWAANGVTSFKLVANDDAGTYTNFISPCGPQVAGPDGTSAVQAVLMYSYGMVDYEIQNAAGTPIQGGSLTGSQTTATLSAGNYKVKYTVADNSGVVGMAMYNLTVRDTVRPIAKCKDAFINTFPTGKKDTLTAAIINNGSTDNCSANLTYTLSRSEFSCLDIPQNPITITLTVRDTSGNTSTCNALVQINTAAPLPTFEPACDGGTLKLFANPPVTPGGTNYTYMWTGPNGYTNNVDQNPVIPNATKLARDGTYTVKITGVPGCTATGNVTVTLIAPPPKPNLMADSTDLSYCVGNPILLSTASVGATYEWYEVLSPNPNPMLLGSTTQPNFTINTPSIGQHQYFVRATGNGCTSQNSDSKFITMNPVPTAQVEAPLVIRCEGESLTLGAVTTPGSGVVYYWAPLNVYSQFPLVTISLDSALHAGFYTLSVFQGGCRSNPSVMEVRVKKKPAKPTLTTAKAQVCEGANVLLISSISQAAEYRWKSPDQTKDTVTSGNSLNLVNITKAWEGSWRVTAFKDGCESQISDPLLIEVQEYPDVTAPTLPTICQNDTLFLSATADKQIATWAWTGPGFSSFEQNPTRIPGVSGVYKVLGKTSFGCADSAFVTALVSVPPQISASNDAFECLTGNQTIHLISKISAGDGPFTFMWSGPNGYKSTDSIGLIPNATAIQTGAYNLVVKDKYGCPSAIATTNVAGQNIPVTPNIETVPKDGKACPGEMVVLQVTNASAYTGSVKYHWMGGAIGTTTTTVPEYKIFALNAQFAGDYTVIVEVDSCISLVSGTATITMNPKPTPPNITSNSPVCSGETAVLTVLNPKSGQTYFWTGPKGYTSDQATSLIPNADSMQHTGQYYCRTTSEEGCQSEQSEGVPLVVHPTPLVPFTLLTMPLCLGQPNTLRLRIDSVNATAGATYQWFNAATNASLGPPSTSPTFQTTNLASVLQPGANNFYVVATRTNCPSGKSQQVTVWADTIPSSKAFAGPSFVACDTTPFLLNAVMPTVGSGTWTLFNGGTVQIVNPNSDSTLVRKAQPGGTYTFAWTISAGACKNYSQDTMVVKVNRKQTAVSPAIITKCAVTEAQLSATQGDPILGFWSQDTSQYSILNVRIADSSQTNTSVGPLTPGVSYFFYWNINVPGCPPSVSQTVLRSLSPKPFLGPNVTWCSPDATYLLQAPMLPSGQFGETGRWYSPETNLVFQNPTSLSSLVSGLKPGKNTIIWEINGGQCGLDSRDTLIIDYGLAPVLTNDEITVPYGTKVTIDVLKNDLLPSTFDAFIVAYPMGGKLDSISDGLYTYQPNGSFSDKDVAFYRVCNFVCPLQTCATASITFNVQKNVDCPPPTVITPNGDDLNDAFVVGCQQGGDGPTNRTVTVFNQWGDEVFHKENYQNDWKGTNSGGEDLPVGTYYVIVDFGDGSKPYAGFLMIQR